MNACQRLAAIALVLLAARAPAQDALRGKLLYLDGGRLNGSGLSCVDCHGGLPGALHGLAGRAAGNPAAISYALGAISQMAPLRGRLADKDLQDLAAYIARPGVFSPDLRFSSPGRSVADRLELSAGSAGRLQLGNAGMLAARLASAPTISGPDTAFFSLAWTDCAAGMTLPPGGHCSVEIAFHADAGPALRSASLGVLHDWIGGGSFVALLGRSAPQAMHK